LSSLVIHIDMSQSNQQVSEKCQSLFPIKIGYFNSDISSTKIAIDKVFSKIERVEIEDVNSTVYKYEAIPLTDI